MATQKTIIYYDFTSVESFLLSEAVAGSAGESGLEWRGVQVDPAAPVPARPIERRARTRLEMDVSELMRNTPELAIALPAMIPNTRLALAAVASVSRLHPARAAAFRTRLFREYWRNGADISDPGVLQRIAEASGVPPWVDLGHFESGRALAAWELDWKTDGLGGVPRAIRPDGRILWGAKDVPMVQAFFNAP